MRKFRGRPRKFEILTPKLNVTLKVKTDPTTTTMSGWMGQQPGIVPMRTVPEGIFWVGKF